MEAHDVLTRSGSVTIAPPVLLQCRSKGSFGTVGPGVREDAPMVSEAIKETLKEMKDTYLR